MSCYLGSVIFVKRKYYINFGSQHRALRIASHIFTTVTVMRQFVQRRSAVAIKLYYKASSPISVMREMQQNVSAPRMTDKATSTPGC